MGLYILHWALTALMFWLMWANREQTGAPPSFWDSLYFSFVTFSTIGFGDYNPDWHSWDVVPAYIATFIGLVSSLQICCCFIHNVQTTAETRFQTHYMHQAAGKRPHCC